MLRTCIVRPSRRPLRGLLGARLGNESSQSSGLLAAKKLHPLSTVAFPAEAGTHFSASRALDEWTPACAGDASFWIGAKRSLRQAVETSCFILSQTLRMT